MRSVGDALQRRPGEAVDGAQIAKAHFEDAFLSVAVEGIGATAGKGAAVFEVGAKTQPAGGDKPDDHTGRPER